MHYHAEIYLESIEDWEEQVEEIMHPYWEELDVTVEVDDDGEEYWNNPDGFWDWYQIGGRFTGSHDDYNPENDPQNYEPCHICGGTGYRNDELGIETREKTPSYTCNGCGRLNFEKGVWEHGPHGPGVAFKWPTSWAFYNGDVCEIDKVKDDLTCYTLLVNDEIYWQELWDGEHFIEGDFDGNVKKKLKELGIESGYLVTVDYHN